jgi:hypothetical protein
MKIETVSIDSIKEDEKNARTHGPRNLDAIKNSLDKFKQQKPIVVDKNGVVVAGNGTLRAALELGWKKIDVVRTGLEGDEARAFAITDNRSAELADWDYEILASTIGELGTDLLIGWDAEELSALADVPIPGAGTKEFPLVEPGSEEEREVECPECGHKFSV